MLDYPYDARDQSDSRIQNTSSNQNQQNVLQNVNMN